MKKQEGKRRTSVFTRVSSTSGKNLRPKWQFCRSTQPPLFMPSCINLRACTSCPCPIEMYQLVKIKKEKDEKNAIRSN
jgi:hypothetical protein